MENQRVFLYIALVFLLYIIWLTWQQEHAPTPPVVATQDANEQITTDRMVSENIGENISEKFR